MASLCPCACFVMPGDCFVQFRFLVIGCKDKIVKWENSSGKLVRSYSLEKGALHMLFLQCTSVLFFYYCFHIFPLSLSFSFALSIPNCIVTGGMFN